MNLFDHLVDEALKTQSALAPLRPVVEKELLHHDILREMSAADLLGELTFIGGTCLRTCYGSKRLSEDLNFTGGADFDRTRLRTLGRVLVEHLEAKYGLVVTVSDPVREAGNVDTWKIKVITRPARKDLPAQRINIDICAVPSYRRRPMLLRNPYGVDMGTGGLIIQAESRDEILADKIVALALRPNRLKNRDLWDIGWLKQEGVEMAIDLVARKIADHHRSAAEFLTLLDQRRQQIRCDVSVRGDFVAEMRRFLPAQGVHETVGQPAYWEWLADLVDTECDRVVRYLKR